MDSFRTAITDVLPWVSGTLAFIIDRKVIDGSLNQPVRCLCNQLAARVNRATEPKAVWINLNV
jgi:hypothetical protein